MKKITRTRSIIRQRRSAGGIEALETRIAPAFTSTVAGSVASFSGDAADDSLVITESAGFLAHNRFTAGDAGFNSALDFDSTVAGDQTLAIGVASIINVNGGAGTDTLSETRSTDFAAGALTLGGSITLANSAGAHQIDVTAPIAGAGFTLTADAINIGATINGGTNLVTLKPFTAGALIDLGGADVAGTLGLTATELNFVTAGVVHIGSSTSGNLSFTQQVAPSGTAQLELETGGAMIDANAGNDIAVARLGLFANTGITVTTNVGNIEAQTGTGGISVTEANDLIIGGVNATLTGLSAAGGDITITLGSGSASFNVNEAILNSGGGSISLATGTDTSGTHNLNVNAGVTASGGNGSILFNIEDNVILSAPVSAAGTGGVTLIADQTTGISANAGNFINSGAGTVTTVDGDIHIQAGDSITVGAALLVNGTGAILIDANAAIDGVGDFNNSGTGTLSTHGGGITFTGTANNITFGAAVSVLTGNGSVLVDARNNINVNAPVSVVGAGTITMTADFDGVSGGGFGSSGAGTITSVAGLISLSGNNVATLGAGVFTTGGGAISVTALAASGDLNINAPVSTDGGNGNISFSALDQVNVNADVSILGLLSSGTVSVTAGGDFAVNNASEIATTNGTISATARSITIGTDSAVTVNGGGNISFSAGLNSFTTFTNQGHLSTTGGNITIRFDDHDLQAGSSMTVAANREINLRVNTGGVGGDLGSAASGGLNLTQTELDTVTAGQLRLTVAANITLSQSVTLANAKVPTLLLEAVGGIIDGTAGEQTDLTVTNLGIKTSTGIGDADDLDVAVTNLAFRNVTSGGVHISSALDLTINSVFDITTSTNSAPGAPTSVSSAGAINLAVNVTSQGLFTLQAGGPVTQGPGESIAAPGLQLLGSGPFTLTNPGNHVDTLTADTTGSISYVDADSFTPVGVSSGGGNIDLTALTGSITVTPVSEVQTLTVGGAAGTFTLTFNGQTTGAIDINSATLAADIENALNALPSIGGIGGVVFVNQNGSEFDIAFNGFLINTDVPQITSTPQPGVTADVATETDGGAMHSYGGNITFHTDSIDITGLVDAGTGIVTITPHTPGIQIDVGGVDAPGTLGLTTTELGFIKGDALRLGDINLAGDITITAPLTPLTNTLSLLSSGGISQDPGASITVANLLAAGVTGVSLNDSGNLVDVLAGVSDGAFSFFNSTSLTIGPVDPTLFGVSHSGIATGGAIDITAGGAGSLLTVDQPIGVFFGFNGDITLTADDMAINAVVSAGQNMVTLEPFTPGRQIDLGTDTAGKLGLTDAELDFVTAGLLRIGHPDAGNLVVTAPISPANAPILSLFTAGSITSTGPGSIADESLALHAGTGIGLNATPLATVVQSLAFENETGLVNIANTGMLTIAEVDDLPTSANHGTTTTLSATAGAGPGGIVFAVDTLSHGTLTATAVESSQPQDDIRIKFLVNVTSEAGDIRFFAGDGIIAEENSVISALNDIYMQFGNNDQDGISFVDLRGFIFGRLLTLQAGPGHESITLANLDNINVQVINIRTGVDTTPDSVKLLDSALGHEINASLRLGGYISVLGFKSEVRIFETTAVDTLTIGGREGNDTLTAQPGIESKVGIILDGGAGDDVLTGNGILVGGEGNDALNGGTGNDVLLGDGGVEFLYGLTTNGELVRYAAEAPDTLIEIKTITGVNATEALIGLDARPGTGVLYAIGKDATGAGSLYTIDPLNGAATLVAALTASAGDAFTTLNGTEFGFDFNPAADRLRVVSDSGQSIRVNPDTGAVITDTALNGDATSLIGAAYTNNFTGTVSTTLYGIDAGSDHLFRQGGVNGSPSPNGGALTDIGALGLDVDAVLGFDIVPGTGTAYAALVVGGVSGLYTIDLYNGVATFVGNFDGGVTLRGLAVGTTQGNDMLNGGAGNNLLSGGEGSDTLNGGVGDDRLFGGNGDDIITGGLGADVLNGGAGIDTLRETRDADFTLTNSALTIGAEAAETLTGFESIELTGGASANTFHVGAFTGRLKVTGGGGSDTLDYGASTLGITVDLDLVGIPQTLNNGGASLLLGDVAENFVGSAFNDTVSVDAASFPRFIDGAAPTIFPGTVNAPIPPGDHLTVDGRGQFVKIQKTGSAGSVTTPGFADITFSDTETVDTINSSGDGGFGGTTGTSNALSTSVNYLAGGKPSQVVTGDLNGDGFADIVTISPKSKTLSVLIAAGNGTFLPTVNYKLKGLSPSDLVLGNVDDNTNVVGGDSDLDVIITSSTGAKIAVLLNDGTGAFGLPTTFKTVGGSTAKVKVGDFNGDGLLDLATLNTTRGALNILLNTGNGVAGTASFGAAKRIGIGRTTDFAIANFDGDLGNHADIIMSQATGMLRVLVGAGDGTFALQSTKYSVGSHPSGLAIADFNNDGIVDVAVNHVTSEHFVSILFGRSNAGGDLFQPQLRTTFAINFRGARTMIAGDFNGDGNADLAFGSDDNSFLRIARGSGDGSFQRTVTFLTNSPLGGKPLATALAVGDFNGDGALDFVKSNAASNFISVVLRTPTV